MNFVADELLTIAVGSTVTLTRSTLDQAGSSRVIRAILYNHDVTGDSTVALRFVNAPDVAGFLFRPLAKTEVITIDGYNDLAALQIKNKGAVTAKIFVQYFS